MIGGKLTKINTFTKNPSNLKKRNKNVDSKIILLFGMIQSN